MINIGKYVNTHGIKGEIRIISNFSRKDIIFKPGFKLYIDNKEFIVKSYRVHKNYDMVLFEGVSDINDIEYLKGASVFVNRDDIGEFIDEDLYLFKVSINDKKYDIKDIIENKNNKILVTSYGMIPYVDEFIVKKDLNNKIIYMEVPNGLEDL